MGDAIIWWLALELLGLAAVPLAAVVLRALPDRGYSMSKALGLLVTGWLAYTVAMLKIAPFGRLMMLAALLIVAALSVFLLMRKSGALMAELRAHFGSRAGITYIVACEALFLVAYILWAWARAYNPNIVDQEKFMDFGFLNAILKSPTFPPNDMWLAGFSINYYYFGYVLVAGLTALSGVRTEVAFNLANVTLFALTALGAFGVVYNLIASRLLLKPAPHRGARRQAAQSAQPVVVAEAPAAHARAGGGEVPRRRSRSAGETTTAVAEAPTVQAEAETHDGDGAHDGHEPAEEHDSTDARERERPTQRIRATRTPAYTPAPDAALGMRRVPWFLSPYLYGVLAALMVVAMGNLTTMFAVKDRTMSDLEGNQFRFCFACNKPEGYDWFSPSRIIQDYRTTQVAGAAATKEKVGFETINEFPAFSFLLADMHPHVLALPLVLLAVAAGFALSRRRVIRAATLRDGIPPGVEGWLSIGVIGLIAGSLYTSNTWDFPTYLLVILLCLAIPYVAAGRRAATPAELEDSPRRGAWAWLKPLAVQVALLVVFSLALFIPFHLTFKSLVGGAPVQVPENLANLPLVGWVLQKLGELVLINTADKTILGFVVIFGIFLFALLVWLAYEFVLFVRRRVQAAGGAPNSIYIWAGFFVLALIVAFLIRFPLLGLLLPVAAVSFAMVWREPRRIERNVALVLVGVSALIGLAIEVVFLRDNFQMRMNTLFKFYFQLWIMFALAAGYAFWRVLYAVFAERDEAATTATASTRRSRDEEEVYRPSGAQLAAKSLAGVWAALFLFLVLTGCLYTWFGVQSRQVAGQAAARGLDGATWIRDSAPGDYDAISWLKENGTGNDVVLEAGSDEYRWQGRVSAYTGVPTLIAWDNSHEHLWRTNQPEAAEAIGQRRALVNNIYQGKDPDNGTALTTQRLVNLLRDNHVTYVFAGATERGEGNWAPGAGDQKMTEYAESVFKAAMPEAFRSGTTVIYAVKDTVSGTGVVPPTPSGNAATTPTVGATTGPDLNVPPVNIFTVNPPGANRGQLNKPRGLARDGQGRFYVVDTQNLRIQVFEADGTWRELFGGKGSTPGRFNPFSDEAFTNGDGTGPGGVAVDKPGNIYVADTWNHRIQKFDFEGNYLLSWGQFVNLADQTGANAPDRNSMFYGPRGVAVGPDGNIYVTDTGNKRVSIFDPNGKFVREISSGVTPARTTGGDPYNKDGEMNEPVGIAVDGSGNVYVADVNNRRIQKFDSAGKYIAQWPVPAGAWDPGPFLEPFLALDGSGNLYATAPTSKAVLKFSPTGELLGQKTTDGTVTLSLPTGLWVDPDGMVYVTDTGNNAVLKLGQVP